MAHTLILFHSPPETASVGDNCFGLSVLLVLETLEEHREGIRQMQGQYWTRIYKNQSNSQGQNNYV